MLCPAPRLELTEAAQDRLKSEAVAVCEAFARSSVQVVVFDASLLILATSLRGDAGLHSVARVGTDVRTGMAPELVSSLFPPSRQERRSKEFNGRLWLACAVSEAAWVVECVPWESEHPPGLEPVVKGGLLIVRQDAERQALRTRLEKESRFEALGRVAASVAHDFNNLLTGIRGSLALVRQSVENERSHAALAAADGAAARAGELTRELLNFGARQERSDIQAELRSVVLEAVALVRCLPEGLGVEVDIAEDIGLISIAPGHLHQVVMNLLMNARQATARAVKDGRRSEPVRVSARFEQQSRSPAGEDSGTSWVVLKVEDKGAGMDERTQQRVFEPFFTTKQQRDSTGLGLCTVKQLVERAGGWVDFDSSLAVGTCFRVHLPCSAERRISRAKASVTKPLAGRTVLICDDESRLASLTAGLLKEFGYQAATVATGDDAVRVVERDVVPIHVLLLDVNLGGDVSAKDVLSALDEMRRSLPVVLTSGLAERDIPRALTEHPRVAGYLGKPYTVNELTDAIEKAT